MRFLYCIDSVATLGSEGDFQDINLIQEFRRAGHRVDDLLIFDVGSGDDAVMKAFDTTAGHVGVQVEAVAEASSGETIASLILDRLDESKIDAVIARGQDLNAMLARNENISRRLWSVLSKIELDSLVQNDELEGISTLQEIVHNSSVTLVENNEIRDALKKAMPADRHKVVSLVPGEGGDNSSEENPLTRLGHLLSAKSRVLFYRDSKASHTKDWASMTFEVASSMASADTHVVVMCHEASVLFSSIGSTGSEYVTFVEPTPARHQIADGRLQPRFAAWHVAEAARQLDCAVVITDDLETVTFGRSNEGLRRRLWPVIAFDGLQAFADQRQLLEELSEWVPRLVVCDEESRSILESRIPAATSKTILLSGLLTTQDRGPFVSERAAALGIELRGYLDRFVPDYSIVAKLKTRIKVVLAGHDFKFAGELLDVLARREDVELRTDYWRGQNTQDEDLSRALLEWADVIFCEFASNNAVWYSWEKKEGQTLIVRFHGYELWSPWIQDINLSNVDKIVFVSEFYRDKVVQELGWPRNKTAVIPNVVDVLDLNRPKREDARFQIGIVGIVPILKRPDRALDLLEFLLESDDRYCLHIRGRSPWEYAWMWKNDDVRDAYEAFYERLAADPQLVRRVSFEGFGPDMGRWFQNIGWMLSPSFRETFHLAPVEGMASGAVPVVWDREGAREIFGTEWVHENARAAASYIISTNRDPEKFSNLSNSAIDAASQFDILENGRTWVQLILETDGEHSDIPAVNIFAVRVEEIFDTEPTGANLVRLVDVLVRDGNWKRIDELVREHPDLVVDLPERLHWRMGLHALGGNRSLVPQRSEGAAYLSRRDAVLLAVEMRRIGDPAFALSQSCRDDVELGMLRLVAVTSVDIDSDQSSENAGRGAADFNGSSAVHIRLRNACDLRVDKFVLAAADALVREARVFRPAAIASQSGFRTALPALIAARRLGVPFLIESCLRVAVSDEAGLTDMIRLEADGVFDVDESPLISLQRATSSYAGSVDAKAQRSMSSLKVGVIADEFTSRTIAHSFETVPLSRVEGYLQLSSLDLDAVFIESAWEGPQDEWRRGVAYHPDRIDDLRRIIKVANARSIPVIFWNKEDPVHFLAFERTAGMIDHVFTTDADMVGRYLQNSASSSKTVSSMPFYAEPEIHNPLPTDRLYDHTVSYAGTYYGDRFRERSVELNRILDAAKIHGLTIYDRQVTVPNSPYRFPKELASFVREGVPYNEVLKVYKSHPVNINVNSADDSPTMFSRRVVEIAASGSVVLSGRGRGITEQLRGIEATDSYPRWAELLESWMTDERERLNEAWRQMRTVTRSHLAEHALTIMMRTAGLAVRASGLPSYALWAESLSLDDANQILRQSWRPETVMVQSDGGECVDLLRDAGVEVRPGVAKDDALLEQSLGWIGCYAPELSATHYEDLLHATRFGEWSCLAIEKPIGDLEPGRSLIRVGPIENGPGVLYKTTADSGAYSLEDVISSSNEGQGLTWMV